MAHGHRRHVKGSPVAARGVVVWGTIGLVAGCGLLIAFGVSWVDAVLGTGGLLVILLVAYALERAGLMRPPAPDPPDRVDVPPQTAAAESPREPPVPRRRPEG